MNRIEWKQAISKAGHPILSGSVGDVPAFTIRRRQVDDRSMLSDRLQQQIQVHDTEDGAKKDAEHRLGQFMGRIGAQFNDQILIEFGEGS